MQQYWRITEEEEEEEDEGIMSCFGCCSAKLPRVETADEEETQTSNIRGPQPQTFSRTASESQSGRSRTSGSDTREAYMEQYPGSMWNVARSADHGGKLFWIHKETNERTWKQPPPKTANLPANVAVGDKMRRMTRIVNQDAFMGAPSDPHNSRARTGICGSRATPVCVRRTCELLAVEHELYPLAFLTAVGLQQIILCKCCPRARP